MEPEVAGKPQPPLFEESVRRVGGERPLVVGDRLDTDIEGAVNAGLDSLLVLTGVTGLAELVAARPGLAPDVPRPGPARARTSRTRRSSSTDGRVASGAGGVGERRHTFTLKVKVRPPTGGGPWPCAAWAPPGRDRRAVDVSDLEPPT